MSGLSKQIEEFIKSMLEMAEDGTLEMQRSQIAKKFQCAPSQINYVLSTRFPSSSGYYVESKRGGGGFIKIIKITVDDPDELTTTILESIGDSITKTRADLLIEGLRNEGLITDREQKLMKAAASDRSLVFVSSEERKRLRAEMIKNMLLIIMEG